MPSDDSKGGGLHAGYILYPSSLILATFPIDKLRRSLYCVLIALVGRVLNINNERAVGMFREGMSLQIFTPLMGTVRTDRLIRSIGGLHESLE